MRKIFASCLFCIASVGYAQHQGSERPMNQDSSSMAVQAPSYMKILETMRSVHSQVLVDMMALQQVCLPGPDGWIHVYGDGKTGAAQSRGCMDDLHLQCTYNPRKGQYYVTKAVWGCNANHPNL